MSKTWHILKRIWLHLSYNLNNYRTIAAEIGLRDVVIEGDSEIIFNHLTSDSVCLASFGNLVADVKFAAQAFCHCSFSHVKRNGNFVADKLVKLAKHAIVPQIWLEDIHSDATYLVSIDKSFCWSSKISIWILKNNNNYYRARRKVHDFLGFFFLFFLDCLP